MLFSKKGEGKSLFDPNPTHSSGRFEDPKTGFYQN